MKVWPSACIGTSERNKIISPLMRRRSFERRLLQRLLGGESPLCTKMYFEVCSYLGVDQYKIYIFETAVYLISVCSADALLSSSFLSAGRVGDAGPKPDGANRIGLITVQRAFQTPRGELPREPRWKQTTFPWTCFPVLANPQVSLSARSL